MATKSYEELIAGAQEVKSNELPESNTHQLVGEQFLQMVEKQQEVDLQSKSTILNITTLVPLTTGYYNLATAIAAVPALTSVRKKGLELSIEVSANVWEIYKYNGPDYAGFTLTANWELIFTSGRFGNYAVVADFNTINKSGNYTAYGAATGAPTEDVSWFVEHINSSVGIASSYQRAIAYSADLIIYERTKINSVWGAWKQTGVTKEELAQLRSNLNETNANIESVKGGNIDDSVLGLNKLTPEALAYIGAGGEVTNLADGEDLENVEIGGVNVVREKSSKAYDAPSYSGLGRVILRKNMVGGVNVLTQAMLNQANTVYEIRYDFDLNSQPITIPENCKLFFFGGSVRNGTLIAQGADLSGNYKKKIFINIELTGDYVIDCVYPEWFGAQSNNNNIDNYESIQKSINLASLALGDKGCVVKLRGRYYISQTLFLYQGCILQGDSPRSTWILPMNTFTGNWIIDTYDGQTTPLASVRINNLQIRCSNITIGEVFENTKNGIRLFGVNETCGLSNLQVTGYSDFGIFIGPNAGGQSQNCKFSELHITNTNNPNNSSAAFFLDSVTQCVFDTITVDQGPTTIKGCEYGIKTIGNCDLNTFIKTNIEDCYYPFYFSKNVNGIGTVNYCNFLSTICHNPTHVLKKYTDINKSCYMRLDVSSLTGMNLFGFKSISDLEINQSDYDIYFDESNFIKFNQNISKYSTSSYCFFVKDKIKASTDKPVLFINDYQVIIGKSNSIIESALINIFDNLHPDFPGNLDLSTGNFEGSVINLKIGGSTKARILKNGIIIGINSTPTTMPVDSLVIHFADTNKAISLPRSDTSLIATPYRGSITYSLAYNKVAVYNGLSWVGENGEKVGIPQSGPYANRPLSTSTVPPTNIGFQYYNTDTHKYMAWESDDKYYYADGTEATA